MIRVLADSVARKIAAGEVIERPLSVVRELLDNALDAGAGSVGVHLEQGGAAAIRVVDNGAGMDAEDLDLCWRSHATSKIAHEDDLLHLSTLGFRGEALSSIAAVSRLRIVSKRPSDATAHRLLVEGGRSLGVEAAQGTEGTLVEVRDLFYNLPGRKRFLKNAGAEFSLCRSAFLEKAIPFPAVSFQLFADGELRNNLPQASLAGRVADACEMPANSLHELSGAGDGFTFRIVVNGPEHSRRDRRFIQAYVNRRRINEYALVQAAQYAFADHLPGGRFPICFFFVEVQPELVDFNIHPAKREARIRNLSHIHHRLGESLARFLRARRPPRIIAAHEPFPARSVRQEELAVGEPPPPLMRRLMPPGGHSPAGSSRVYGFTYLGQAMDLFLIAARGDTIFIVDQHAAHERILYEKYRSAGPVQPLLVPQPIAADCGQEEERSRDAYLESIRDELASGGIVIDRTADGWVISAVSEALADQVGAVSEALAAGGAAASEQAVRDVFALLACRTAVKDGERLDDLAGAELVRQAFELDVIRCPHGRPIWHELSRQELFRLLGRI